VSQGWRRLGRTGVLRRATEMRLHLRASAHLQFVSQHADLSLVVLLHLELVLLQLVDLVPDELHLLNLL
jgi:hypothetical protein